MVGSRPQKVLENFRSQKTEQKEAQSSNDEREKQIMFQLALKFVEVEYFSKTFQENLS